MRILFYRFLALALVATLTFPALARAADFDRFLGSYVGQADEVLSGESETRDLSTTIEATDDGFTVSWTSVIYRADGQPSKKSYEIEFVPSGRDSIYGSAMATNVFGKQVPLDPLRGEPFVWSRFEGDTFTVFSLFINVEGEYEMQEYHRTLVDGGLDLLFRRVSKGVPQREIRAFLARQ